MSATLPTNKKATANRRQPAAPNITFNPTIIPRGDGSYIVTPGKPILQTVEISTREACKILGISRGTIWYRRDAPLGASILRWRFSTPACGRIVWELASVLAYKEALRQLGK